MLNFDYITLEKFLEENKDFLTGARLQKIQQPTRQEIVFTMRGNGETRKFYVNINPQIFHLCFMEQENEQKRYLKLSEQLTKNQKFPNKSKYIYSPPMFCMLLRKYLESAKIAKINQPKEERILEFYFEIYNELSEKIYICLAIELMGKHSNVILYNYDTNIILGCMHNVGAEKSSVREVIGNLPYTYPPKKKNIIKSGFSSVLDEKVSVNKQIDNYFAKIQEQEKIKHLKTKLFTVTNSKLKKIQNSLSKIQKQTKTQEKINLYRKKGDLIMANLFGNQDFISEIEVLDYETNSPLKIQLDKTKTLKENANQFYKLYNKAKTANIKTTKMRENLLLEQENFQQLLYSIELATTVEDLLEISEEHDKEKIINKTKTSHLISQALRPLTINLSQFKIYIGKNNKQNDYIVSKLAKDEDLWFHIHNCAGSHVLLKIESGQIVTDEIIFECAKLAKEYSTGKNSSKVGIIYTKAKNLKKPPSAPLGYVIYKGEKEIIID